MDSIMVILIIVFRVLLLHDANYEKLTLAFIFLGLSIICKIYVAMVLVGEDIEK